MSENTTYPPVAKPEMIPSVGAYLYKFPTLQLEVKIDHIGTDHQGIFGELAIWNHSSSSPQLLEYTRLHLSSTDARVKLSKSLTDRYENTDWWAVINYCCYLTIDHYRSGEEVVWLNSDYGYKRPEYLLPPLFIKNAMNIIYADRSSAKSLFVTLIDLMLSIPWHDNPLGLETGTTRHSVLFLDWESNAEICGWQKECLRRGLPEMGWCDIPYLHCSQPLCDSIEYIRNKIDGINADTIIVDSLGMAVGDDLNLTKPAFAFFSALRQLPVTPIVVAHTSKDILLKRKTVYGNAYYENEARSIWELAKKQDLGSNELLLSMYHRKPAPFVPIHEPLGFKFTFDGDITRVEVAEPISDKRIVKEDEDIKPEERVLVQIDDSGTPLKKRDLHRLLPDINEQSLGVYLKRLKDTGKIISVDGAYIATSKPQQNGEIGGL